MPNKYIEHSKAAQAEVRKLWACGRKKQYNSKEEAELKNQTVYECEHCGKWHRSASLMKLVGRLNKKRK